VIARGARRARAPIPAPGLARALALSAGLLLPALPAHADLLPSRPISLWNDRLVVSGEATLTVGMADDGYFNAIDYSHDAFNLLTLAVSAELRAHERIAVLGQVVDEVGLRDRDFGPTDRHVLRPYALYVRVQPLADRAFFVQAGRIPPVFGSFARQEYGAGNPLIGLPLAWHYPTVIRPDVVPLSVAELEANRGEGWYVRYPRASSSGQQGVPLTSARRWDTGVQARIGEGKVEAAFALTNGSLSKPLTVDDNGGKQISARLGLRPSAAVSLGVSGAYGEFIGDTAQTALSPALQDVRYRQRALGVDGEVSGGQLRLRGEIIASSWKTPFVSGEPTRALDAWTAWLEGRWRVSARWEAAIRGERLQFSTLRQVTSPSPGAGGNPGPYGDPYEPGETPGSGVSGASWDAPVTRVELGASYRLRRNVRAKAAWQYDWRDGGRVRREGHVAVQLGYWF
jgi:hypothetical protein